MRKNNQLSVNSCQDGAMRFWLLLLFAFPVFCSISQTPDSLYHQLPEAEVSYSSNYQRMRLLSSESMIDTSLTGKSQEASMVSAVNTVSGVRMEERSPGSYRLSVRGSLLRSPFGIRNVKIYLGDFPFTDAGGNSYLNSLDLSNVHSIRILKGPESSIFGANTGGVVLIDAVPHAADSLTLKASVAAGSYGLFHETAVFQKRWKKSQLSLVQAYQRSGGYRENSALEKHFVQLSEKWDYHSRASLKILFVFSDLFYETPGGLTLQQFNENPEAARYPTATLPGASPQKASISNRTFFGGISNEYRITRRLKHVISVFGGHTDFSNPFITNYEQRTENTVGTRTYFDLSLGKTSRFTAKINLGGELQQTNALIENYGNSFGNKTALMASDQVNAQQALLFSRLLIDVRQRLLLEASLSYNAFHFSYKNNFPDVGSGFSRRNFNPQLMPGVAASFAITRGFAWRASVRGGYSAPTIAEVRSSDNVVNTALEAEQGISYETGFRLSDRNERLLLDVSAFYFELSNAIVRRMNADGTEFFINAGGTSQPGIEGQVTFNWIKPRTTQFIRSLKVTANGTYNRFTFSDYRLGENDYSGKALTGVPAFTSAETLSMDFPSGINFFAQYYYASALPLNDANSVSAKAYHLLQCRVAWTKNLWKLKFTFFAGADNLLNQRYSLGNDLNAAGSRYYNAAPPRNYYGGLKVGF